MARRSGKKGKLYLDVAGTGALPSPLPFVAKWTAKFTTPTLEATTTDDNNKVYFADLPDAEGTFSGFYDDATAQTYTLAQSGFAAGFYLYPDVVNKAGTYWYGTGIFDYEIAGGIGEIISMQGSWKAASNITKIG